MNANPGKIEVKAVVATTSAGLGKTAAKALVVDKVVVATMSAGLIKIAAKAAVDKAVATGLFSKVAAAAEISAESPSGKMTTFLLSANPSPMRMMPMFSTL